ncbi:MAG: outer membrane protein assembly factor BamC [Pseudomonadota bacterium]
MTIRKTLKPALATAISSALLVSLTGCGMISSVIETDRVEYKGAKKAAKLDVPPDLTQLEKDNRYSVPDKVGSASASTYRLPQQGGVAVVAPGQAVGQVNTDAMHVERNGNQRWLVVGQSPEQLWPQLKQFWTENGFELASESAATGTMETAWAENRAKIPQDLIRRSIGKVFDSLYSTGERDKYRTRLERTANGGTEIYISHRGAEEVLVGAQKETTSWTTRPNDPGLEAIFLSKLMAKLSGAPEAKPAEAAAAGVVANAANAPLHAKLAGDGIEVDEAYDRAWRRVGLALDRVGFTVEDRDRVQGVYFVRYVDPDLSASEGFLKKLFSFGDEKSKEAQRYRISVKTAVNATVSQVAVQTNDGKPDATPTGAKILKLLLEELK